MQVVTGGTAIGHRWQRRLPTLPKRAELLQVAIHRIQPEFDAAQWSIFQRLWIENESPNEVASSMQINIGSVYVVKSRVLKRLRSEVLMLSDDLPLKGTTDALP